MNTSDRIREFLNKKPSKEQKKLCKRILYMLQKGYIPNEENLPPMINIQKTEFGIKTTFNFV